MIRICSAVLVFAGAVSAQIVHDEAVDGDLSNVPDAPTFISLGLGSNIVLGTTVEADEPTGDRDFFTFTIQPGQALQAMILTRYEDVLSGDIGNAGYGAINAGATSFVPSAQTQNDFLGGNLLFTFFVGTDLLANFGGVDRSNGPGFTPPLQPGSYSVVIQQTGPELTGYGLDLVLVPEPGTLALLGWGMLLAVRLRQRVI